ncbi:MAG: efflux RND transporter periplasmic adaptor subunit [Planctomycetaceae bacterium]|nr:efflux RND transporter periplasmic adaptor subunit [Planctomycetales bacterium]MCB9925803.1 efflux RND transporter periplasmic adaptor subunit [Planctomycetaceae bacterium]
MKLEFFWLKRFAISLTMCCIAAHSWAEVVEGFTEPFRTIHVASAESGIVARVFVREGEAVAAGQQLAVLDDEVHRMLLEIARQQMDATGRMNSTRAEVELHRGRLNKLTELRQAGQAYQQEVDRARADVEVALGRLLSIEEDIALKKLEYKKIAVQLDRRTITAPVAGIVTTLTKNVGEYVSPVDPEVVTLVQLNPLRATFLMNRDQSAKVQIGMQVTVAFTDAGMAAAGVVEHISELTDAESGTVPVRIRIENRDGKYRSGERCTMDLK